MNKQLGIEQKVLVISIDWPIMIRVWLSLWMITSLICKLNAAAIKNDLNQTAVNDEDEQKASTNHHSQEYLTMNDTKVVIDLFTPTSRPTNDSKSNDEPTDRKATPIVQLVINKPNIIEKDADNATTTAATTPMTTTTTTTTTTTPSPTTQHSVTTVHSPLIPPASVNASIKQFDKEPKTKQGQIIIRYAYFSIVCILLTCAFPEMHFNCVHEHVSAVRNDY